MCSGPGWVSGCPRLKFSFFPPIREYVDQDSRVVSLFDAVGRFVQVPAALWANALRTAVSHGLRPAGTSAPPRDWGLNRQRNARERWDGCYEAPLGQCVSAGDAQQFGRALGKAMEREVDLNIAALASFSSRGSFIICPFTTELRRSLSTLPPTPTDSALPDRDGESLLHMLQRMDQFRPEERQVEVESAAERVAERP